MYENDEICLFDFTNGYLPKLIFSDITWITLKQSRANAELVSLASTLNNDKETVFVRTENSKKIEVIIPFTLVGLPPKILFFLPSSEHKNRGLDFSAARPPYWPYLGTWMELEDI